MAAPDVHALFDLRGRVAVVTGGSRGLGRAMCRGFAAAGARVVVASRKLDACVEVADRIVADGGDALAVACHMGDGGHIEALVEATVERYGGIDCVVNNAATPLRVGVVAFDDGLWRKAMDVNAWG